MKFGKIACIIGIMCALSAGVLTGCGGNGYSVTGSNGGTHAAGGANDNNESETAELSEEAKKAIEVFQNLNPTDTIEEMNNTIGFEAKENDKEEEKYRWDFDDKTYIKAGYVGGSETASFQLTVDKEALADDSVSFSCYSDISKNAYTYDEIKEKVGGADGLLAGITSTSKRYIWVDKHGNTLSVTFSDNSGGKSNIVSMR